MNRGHKKTTGWKPVVFFWEEGLSGGEPDNPCMKKSIVGGSEVVSF
jgi:hypothetical protein